MDSQFYCAECLGKWLHASPLKQYQYWRRCMLEGRIYLSCQKLRFLLSQSNIFFIPSHPQAFFFHVFVNCFTLNELKISFWIGISFAVMCMVMWSLKISSLVHLVLQMRRDCSLSTLDWVSLQILYVQKFSSG